MAKKYNAMAVAEKQVKRVGEATQDYINGVQAITEHPGKMAAKKQAKMKSKLIQAIDSGKWAENVSSYSLDEYKQKATTVGANRLAEGVQASLPKVVEFHEQLSAHIAATQDAIDAIDDSTEAGARQKMNANYDRMKGFKRVKRRR